MNCNISKVTILFPLIGRAERSMQIFSLQIFQLARTSGSMNRSHDKSSWVGSDRFLEHRDSSSSRLRPVILHETMAEIVLQP